MTYDTETAIALTKLRGPISRMRFRDYKADWQRKRRATDSQYREREAAAQLRRYYRIQAAKFFAKHPFEDQPGAD